MAIVALIVAIVVLSGTLALGLTQWGRGNHTRSHSAATGSPGSATQTQVVTPLTTASAQPSPSGEPTDTGTPGGRPSLTVSPTTISMQLCASNAQFDVQNTGGGTLDWTATAPQGLLRNKINPSSGSLAAGQDQMVTVSGITLLYGQVTVSAPGASPSLQTVTITCQIL